jgi:3-oxoadipate enol-lactonase
MTIATNTIGDRVRVNETDLNVRVDGPAGAPWLVLSNSLGSSLSMWEPQVAAFSREYRVLRYDTRGHGRSSVPARPYTIDQLGLDVLGLLDAFGVERAHFCGLSMGGSTGMWLAVHAPQRIGRLVLCNTTPWLGPAATMNARIATMLGDGMPTMVEAILERWFTAEFRARDPLAVDRVRQELLATPVAGYVGCCEAIRDMDQRATLAQIAAPTLVIAGTFDPAPTPAAAREWASAIPHARFVELPAAHLSNIGAATAFNDAVLAFLGQGIGAGGSSPTVP